ncbi:MAG: hypothetical protein WAL47_03140 [Pyrinomonadaceae bacterium]
MQPFLLLHGESIFLGFLLQCLLALLGLVACVYGVVKYSSTPSMVIAFGYFAATVICALLFFRVSMSALESLTLALTLPWNLIMPCFDPYLGPCRLSLGGAFVCAELNAAALYYLVAWRSRPK